VARLPTPEFWSKQKKSERKFLRRYWNFAIRGSRVTTLDRVANCNWPPKFKPVSLPKHNGFGNSRQFLMRYESAVNLAGGDDVVLAKSFIIAYEGPVLNWYFLLQPHSVCSWVNFKTKFIQAFQIFHETTAQSSYLYNCKQKDREPLWNFVRRFMQPRFPKRMIKQQYKH
jgi:hypothetical protein